MFDILAINLNTIPFAPKVSKWSLLTRMSDQNLVQACTFLTVPMRTKPQLYVYSPRFDHPNDTYISPH